MLSRGRNNLAHDWDPMRDDYDNTYDAQYPDNETSGGVQLDHCKLYVTNLPTTITVEGLRTVFSAYGTVVKIHLSRDPNKRYALITYGTSSEAKLAMMKMNKTEPFKLNIHVAHKRDTPQKERKLNNNAAEPSHRNYSCSSTSSRELNSLNHDEFAFHLNNELDDINNEDDLQDPDTGIEMELVRLKLDSLRLREEEIRCKQRLLQLYRSGQTSSQNSVQKRRLLPDGRVVVRNGNDRAPKSEEKHSRPPHDQPDSTLNSAAGDLSSLPTLQRASSRACLACGAAADWFCSRCGLAPYCGAACQQRDWTLRHHNVCHNLARHNESSADAGEKNSAPGPSRPAPHRRPRSPAASADSKQLECKTNEVSVDRSKKNFVPAGQNNYQKIGNKPSVRAASKRFNDLRLGRTPAEDQEAGETLGSKAATKPATAAPAPAPEPIPATSKNERTSVAFSHQQAAKKQPEVAKGSTVPELKKAAPPGTVSDATPGRIILPKNYLVETLSIGDTVLLSVDARASDCRSRANGYVCLSLHEKSAQDYQLLCGDYSADCEAAPECKPKPGELFSYFNDEDGAYYRARCLNPTTAAFVDSSKVVTVSPADKCKGIAPKYEALPEFCCVLDTADVKIGDTVMCTLKSKSAEGYIVQVENSETGTLVGNSEITRWKPQVDYPAPKAMPAAAVIPEVPRPSVSTNSTVVLVEMSALDRAMVRPTDSESIRKFDTVLQDVLQFGMKATPISEPPRQGQVVIGKFSDGNYYRALCKRINVKMNKYQLEYIEFGNIEINTRETIYACPPHLDLNSTPTVVSLVKLQVNAKGLTAAATEFVENLRDSSTELIMTLPDSVKSAPSGSEVCLFVAKNKESVNRKIELMCTPDWKKIEDRGGDVVEIKPLMIGDLEYPDLPSGGCEIDVLDVSMLSQGAISGCHHVPGAMASLEAITKEMEEYCNSELGKKPYLPKFEELCIAKCPPYPQWFRAILCEQVGGPGGPEARLCYVDYGNLETVPVALLRKMLPEFVRGRPALAFHLEIRGFPETPDNGMLVEAVRHMNIDEEGRGVLRVTRCEKIEPGYYVVDAPELMRAMGA